MRALSIGFMRLRLLLALIWPPWLALPMGPAMLTRFAPSLPRVRADTACRQRAKRVAKRAVKRVAKCVVKCVVKRMAKYVVQVHG